MDRRPYSEWLSKRDDSRDWTEKKARQILEKHRPDSLSPGPDAEPGKILESFKKNKDRSFGKDCKK